ncbi:NADH dehydrogenase [Thermosipho melanesiensis]|uniref:NADH dehydrogenase n=1 Tax=Thermosipho melanesiensis TaxID=46541 RepID=A0ABN4UYL8_9BACT|nr:NADH-quinone oxidoreductase subunit B [Thermosipho melanesiensis]APT74167.1 NADH dehydrogenase [Thermosipho melanesiensis]OOC36785.1 NADH dehydrogenase [Thermosipho melanesiensis]OOC37322.1 NADH dehydrogenase [Thermosipho melanesiensis]OOC38075.1 NADH dehydrogenase [Thermosipho melanesiensis]OOC41302.1 NADH dehydrogenase [Thermosipho melanesiensis]
MNERNLWEKIADKLRSKSLWMLHYCTGCGAVELPPTMTSRFDMERFGMGPMATPRQADILFITGYLSAKTLRRVIYTYEQMAEPKYVIGFGSCTLNGGIYYDSYATINKLDYYIPVDLYIAGCMPRPEALLEAFNKLMRMIRSGEANGWKKYRENYEWYKQNQIRSLGEVFIHDEFHE